LVVLSQFKEEYLVGGLLQRTSTLHYVYLVVARNYVPRPNAFLKEGEFSIFTHAARAATDEEMIVLKKLLFEWKDKEVKKFQLRKPINKPRSAGLGIALSTNIGKRERKGKTQTRKKAKQKVIDEVSFEDESSADDSSSDQEEEVCREKQKVTSKKRQHGQQIHESKRKKTVQEQSHSTISAQNQSFSPISAQPNQSLTAQNTPLIPNYCSQCRGNLFKYLVLLCHFTYIQSCN